MYLFVKAFHKNTTTRVLIVCILNSVTFSSQLFSNLVWDNLGEPIQSQHNSLCIYINFNIVNVCSFINIACTQIFGIPCKLKMYIALIYLYQKYNQKLLKHPT